MFLLVTSAAGGDGSECGGLLSFELDGKPRGAFSNDTRIVDPRGVGIHQDEELLFLNCGSNRVLALDATGKVVRDTGPIEGLNPGGGNVGPDGRYYVGARTTRTIFAFSPALDTPGVPVLPPGVVSFPCGFGFRRDGRLFLASGVGPNGDGDNTIVAFVPSPSTVMCWLVKDPQLSPLDLAIAPNDNIVVTSEHPFGAPDAATTVREYDSVDGHLVRVFSPNGLAEFRRPRGLRFGPDGHLYCVARDEVVAFDFESGKCLGATITLKGLNGQALTFFP